MRTLNHLPIGLADYDESFAARLTVRVPQPHIALGNLLDLVQHEICVEGDVQLHRLTYKSGEVVVVRAAKANVDLCASHLNCFEGETATACTTITDPGAHHPLP